MRPTVIPAAFLVGVLAVQAGPRPAPAQSPGGLPRAEPPCGPPAAQGPAVAHNPTGLGPARLEEADRALPINLATALRLADARPLVIEAARAAVETEYGLYEQARVLWLPSVYAGVDYQRHDGG